MNRHLLLACVLLVSVRAHSAAPAGTVVGWGNAARSFADINSSAKIISIAAGGSHSLALRADAKVVAWGANDYGQTTVPANLTGVIAIAAGASHSLALRADGTLVAWGNNYYGQSTVPANLTGVVAIAAGSDHS